MDRIDVWCPGERRVVGHLPADVGLLTRNKFWSAFRPETGEYRLQQPEPDGSIAFCPRCRSALSVFVSDVNVALTEAERREVAERRAMARAQYGEGEAVPTRAELRAQIERHPLAAGAVVRHFEGHGEGDGLHTSIVLGSTRIV
jgi:hypothetical protein